jgi:regulator of sirC expression with transglutaminase-like and TPR domain
VLWLELAGGIGLDAHGVGFPGHFLVRAQLPQGPVLLDPFTGQLPSREDLSERLEPLRPAGQAMQASGSVPERYLQAVTPRAIVARMLRNLKGIHRAQEDWARMLSTQNRLVALLPQAWEEFRDRGLVHAELGDVEHAVRDLETYLSHAGTRPDRGAIKDRLADLRGEMRG